MRHAFSLGGGSHRIFSDQHALHASLARASFKASLALATLVLMLGGGGGAASSLASSGSAASELVAGPSFMASRGSGTRGIDARSNVSAVIGPLLAFGATVAGAGPNAPALAGGASSKAPHPLGTDGTVAVGDHLPLYVMGMPPSHPRAIAMACCSSPAYRRTHI